MPSHHFAYVGCRTTRERHARGDGINVYRVDPATAQWEHVQLIADLINPSFLAFGRDQRFLYTVHGDSSEVSAFAVDPASGRLTFLNQVSTQGRNPVHLAFDPEFRFLVISNHATSTLAMLPVGADGVLGEVCDLVTVAGQIGPHRKEQPFAKPHQNVFSPDGRFILVPDKGADCVFSFSLSAKGKLKPSKQAAVQARETSGPRHVVFHPRLAFAYVINELDSTVTSYHYTAQTGALQPFQIQPSLPQSFTGNSRAAEIAISGDGRFIYASNRGFDSVAIFAVDQHNGWLTLLDVVPSGGQTPRFFALAPDGGHLYVANEESDSITAFRVDRATGLLSHTGQSVRTGSPVCILFD